MGRPSSRDPFNTLRVTNMKSECSHPVTFPFVTPKLPLSLPVIPNDNWIPNKDIQNGWKVPRVTFSLNFYTGQSNWNLRPRNKNSRRISRYIWVPGSILQFRDITSPVYSLTEDRGKPVSRVQLRKIKLIINLWITIQWYHLECRISMMLIGWHRESFERNMKINPWVELVPFFICGLGIKIFSNLILIQLGFHI